MDQKHIEKPEEKTIRKECSDRRNHYTDLLVWGHCPRCKRSFALPYEESSIFDRIETIKEIGV